MARPLSERIYIRKCRCCSNVGAVERHHITYIPEKKIRICRSCHADVTRLNTIHAKKIGRKLTNDERIKIFNNYMKFKGGKP